MSSTSFQGVSKAPVGGMARVAWLLPALLAGLAFCVIAGAGWWGYQRQLDGSALMVASTVGTNPVTTPSSEPVATSIAGGAAVSGGGLAGPSASSASTPEPALSWPLWEFRLRQPIPPRDPPLTPPRWRLVGSTLSGGQWTILILRQGKTAPEYFSVGQELPGGYRITAISEEDVTLVQGKRTMVLSYIGSR